MPQSNAPFAAAPLTLTMGQARAFAAGRAGAGKHKPSNWWAREREPWRRPNDELAAVMRETEAMIAALTPPRR